MIRLAFINEKGGTGKTTLAIHMAAFLALTKKQRVLLLDMDSQGHAGKCLGITVSPGQEGLAEVLSDRRKPWNRAVRPTGIPGLDIIPSNKAMAELSGRLSTNRDDITRLSLLLDTIEAGGQYDVAVMDSPPALGPLSLNVMAASTHIVVPVQLSYLALEGCADLVGTIERLRTDYRLERPRLGLVVATFFRRTNMAQNVLQSLDAHFGKLLARSVIGYSVRIDEAQSHGQTVFQYAPGSHGAAMMTRLGEELYRKIVRSGRG